jgi:replication-associated recombination protein RarA
VEKGRHQFILTGKIDDYFFVDNVWGVRKIEDALLCFAVKEGYEIAFVFDDQMKLRFIKPAMEALYSKIVDRDSPSPEGIPWTEELTETERNDRPNTEQAVDEVKQKSATRDKLVLEKVRDRLIPNERKSFVVLKNPETFLEYNPTNGTLTKESKDKLRIICGWAATTKFGNEDTCTILLVQDGEHYERFKYHYELLMSNPELKMEPITLGLPEVEEIEAMLVRFQNRNGLNGNPRVVAKAFHSDLQKSQGKDGLYNVVATIQKKMKTEPFPVSLDDFVPPRLSAENVLEELNKMVGLASVKEKVKELTGLAKLQKRKIDKGEDVSNLTLHAFLLGNPGTGKTVIARILAKLYYALELRSSDRVVEISAADIVSPYNPGDVSVNMSNKIKEAMGGVLFIDEVYQFAEDEWLKRAFENVLMKAMEDHRDNLTVLAAGYGDEQIQSVLKINPGVRSRFNYSEGNINFPDYTIEELVQISQVMLDKEKRTLTPEAHKKMIQYIKSRVSLGKMDNARGVRNLIDTMIKKAAMNDQFEKIEANSVPDDVKMQETVDDILRELDEKFIGLQNVKDQIRKIARKIEHNERHKIVSEQKYNMQFLGNPGTGKTTIARYMSRVFNALGLIEGNGYIEKGATALKGTFIGDAQSNVRKAFEKAREEGKLLFIDEAHNLYSSNPNLRDAYGADIIATLVTEVLAPNNQRVYTILAGYPEAMKHLMEADLGFERRFPFIVTFPDYSVDECFEILQLYFKEQKKVIDVSNRDAIEKRLKTIIEERKKRAGKNFGNAGDMKTLSGNIIDNLIYRDMNSATITLSDIQSL